MLEIYLLRNWILHLTKKSAKQFSVVLYFLFNEAHLWHKFSFPCHLSSCMRNSVNNLSNISTVKNASCFIMIGSAKIWPHWRQMKSKYKLIENKRTTIVFKANIYYQDAINTRNRQSWCPEVNFNTMYNTNISTCTNLTRYIHRAGHPHLCNKINQIGIMPYTCMCIQQATIRLELCQFRNSLLKFSRQTE